MRIVNVAEKPSMAKSITTFLSRGNFTTRKGKNKFCNNFEFDVDVNGDRWNMTMTSVLGHLINMDFSAELNSWHSIDPVELFHATIVQSIEKDKKSIEENIKYEAKYANMLIIWTDCDREGEYIGYEISQVAKASNYNILIKRARFSVVDYRGLFQALCNLTDIDMCQVNAVGARIELDLRFGSIFTRYQTIHLQNRYRNSFDKKTISYGPCQFPTLGFVVEQYKSIINFISEDFYYLTLTTQKRDTKQKTKFKWEYPSLFDKLSASVLYELVLQSRAVPRIMSVASNPTSKWRPLPLRTVEFQKFASRVLKIPSHALMNIAESLYNRGYISYPRTETDRFSDKFDFKRLIEAQRSNSKWGIYAGKLIDENIFRVPRKGSNDDKAHPPIHPTKAGHDLTNTNESRVYEFVVRRFLACCSDDAKGTITTVKVNLGGQPFIAVGLKVTQRNFLDIYIYDTWNDSEELPEFATNEFLDIHEIKLAQGRTTAPSLLAEADLIATMDKNGIGTDATIHEHIKKIQDREYVIKRKDGLFEPTKLGVSLVEAYDLIGLETSLTKPLLRAKMEIDLKSIVEGQLQHQNVILIHITSFKNVYFKLTENIESFNQVFDKYFGPRAIELPPIQATSATNKRKHRNTSNNEHNDDNDDSNDDSSGKNSRYKGKENVKRPRKSTTSAISKSVVSVSTSRTVDSSSDSAVPNCSCNIPAIKLVVQKTGPNKGKTFFKCSKIPSENQCNFFQFHESKPSLPHKSPEVNSPTDVLCNCSLPATIKKVVKAGPTFGKSFYCCSATSKDRGCSFFLWAATSAGCSSNHLSINSSPSPIKCDCDLIAIKVETKKGPNAGRYFYTCPKKSSSRCKYFFWENP